MKKLLSVLLTLALAVIVAAGMTVFAAAETETQVETQTTGIIYGDANNDGAVNMKDVLMLRKYLAGLVETLGA